ncbi:MAG: hypothetical protein PHQ78_03270 [Candidatus Cloacimonetes bacterium]|jgi:hypothetical protein|nr:hypothetical protein [Candidatus Cloacimonadota bacterium]MDD4560113.1 hypothetical protein [Candidatus Cloacimonadota bacterium]
MMEMVLALFAVVLFTTLSLTYNQAIWAQTDYLNNATLVVQASQICHSILDEADAKLFSKQLDLNDLLTEYNYTHSQTYPHLPITFNVEAATVNCDELGNVLTVDDSLSLYKKMTITVSGHRYLQRPYVMHRIYTETFIR